MKIILSILLVSQTLFCFSQFNIHSGDSIFLHQFKNTRGGRGEIERFEEWKKSNPTNYQLLEHDEKALLIEAINNGKAKKYRTKVFSQHFFMKVISESSGTFDIMFSGEWFYKIDSESKKRFVWIGSERIREKLYASLKSVHDEY